MLCAIKTSIIKTLCNVVQYMNKALVQSFSILLLCKKTVQYFVKICAILAILATPKFNCTILFILLNFVNNIGTSWFADDDKLPKDANGYCIPDGTI